MGLLSSLNVGITGINATGSALSVTGDNIANAGTTGFKRSRAEFQDVLALSLKGIDGGDQIGAGTKLAHVMPIFTQGTVQRTDNVTDLAINGDGFFALQAPFGQGFSRDGSMHFNKNGNLVNSDGYEVLGYQANEDGELSTRIQPIILGNTTIPARSTSFAKIKMNIDSREGIKEFSAENPYKTSSYNTSMTVYDNIGTPRLVSVFLNKVEPSVWEYHALVSGDDAEGGEPNTMVEMARGKLTFSSKGILKNESEDSNAFNFNKGAAQEQKIKFDFGQSTDEGGDGLTATTQYGSDMTVFRHTADGATAATLGSLSFNDKGRLIAVYNNGETRDLAQIALAKFENNEGLFKVGKNLFKETRKSGQAALGKPVEGGRGEVLAKSLELSNVDIAQEFVDLMSHQRNFTANTRTITTADAMLNEVLNLKR